MKTIIILGSSRSNGNTNTITQLLKQHTSASIIDLKKHVVHPYSYEHDTMTDDFLTIMREVITYECIVFATPVYWYAMSGIMKNFFDRITDCLKIEKEIGRKLRGMSMAAISCGSYDYKTEGFFVPFRESADYLGMNYLGDIHVWIEDKVPSEEVKGLVLQFAAKIKKP